MYLEHFGLDTLPFRLIPAPEFYSAHGARRQILDALPAILRSGESVVSILGEAGMGKTLLCRRLASTLASDFRAVTLTGSSIGAGGLLLAVLDGLGDREADGSGLSAWPARTLPRALADALERGPLFPLAARAVSRAAQLVAVVAGLHAEEGHALSPGRALRGIARRVLDLAEAGLGAVVIVDDAHCLCPRSLEALQLLADLEPEPDHRVQIVLFGLPELSTRLARPPASSLGQRVTTSFLLGPLAPVELQKYVEGRLDHAGSAHPELFGARALDAVLEASRGVPRLVNVVCHAALLQAWKSGDDQVQRRHVRLAAAETDGAHRVELTAPARAAVHAGLSAGLRAGQRRVARLTLGAKLRAALRATLRVGLQTAAGLRVSVRSRRPVKIKLPKLGPPRRLVRLMKLASLPLVLLLAAIPLANRWIGAGVGADSPLRSDAAEVAISDLLASLSEDPALELPAVSKRNRLPEPFLAARAAPRPLARNVDPTPNRVSSSPRTKARPPAPAPVARAARPSPPAAPAAATRPQPKPLARAAPEPKPVARAAPEPKRARASRPRRATFGKIPHPPGRGGESDGAYQNALGLAASGRDAEAAEVLRTLLDHHPEHQRAREARAAVLIRTGRLDEAVDELETGMVLAPGHPAFAKLRARILSQQGTPDEGLELLQRSPPPLAQDPEYHALIAALYQKLGEHGLAADLYRLVLGVEPQNAAWWMGFGISLEGEGAAESALLAYRAAAALSELGPETQRYVESRIAALSGDRR
ncbi:MAG: AAA family ATPase [Myxococcota bacterium]